MLFQDGVDGFVRAQHRHRKCPAAGQPQLGPAFRQDMVYFSGAEGSPAYNKAREFSQKISTVGVDGRNKASWLFLWGGQKGRWQHCSLM